MTSRHNLLQVLAGMTLCLHRTCPAACFLYGLEDVRHEAMKRCWVDLWFGKDAWTLWPPLGIDIDWPWLLNFPPKNWYQLPAPKPVPVHPRREAWQGLGRHEPRGSWARCCLLDTSSSPLTHLRPQLPVARWSAPFVPLIVRG